MAEYYNCESCASYVIGGRVLNLLFFHLITQLKLKMMMTATRRVVSLIIVILSIIDYRIMLLEQMQMFKKRSSKCKHANYSSSRVGPSVKS